MMPLLLQGAGLLIALGFVALIGYAALYIAGELEHTGLWPLGRAIKAVVGGLIWWLAGLVVLALLFVLAAVLWAVFFDNYVTFATLRFWGLRVAIGFSVFYILWGIYNGAANRLAQSIE